MAIPAGTTWWHRLLKFFIFSGEEPKDWRPAIRSGGPLPRFYQVSPFFYSLVGVLIVILEDKLRLCDAGMWWRSLGLGLVLQGLVSYQADVGTWGHSSKWKTADIVLAPLLTVVVVPMLVLRMIFAASVAYPDYFFSAWSASAAVALFGKIMSARSLRLNDAFARISLSEQLACLQLDRAEQQARVQLSQASDAFSAGKEHMKESARECINQASQSLSASKEQARARIGQASDALSAGKEHMKESARECINQACATVVATQEQAREHSAERVQQACNQLTVAQEQVCDGLQQAREHSAERLQRARVQLGQVCDMRGRSAERRAKNAQARGRSAEQVQRACDQFAVAHEQMRDGFQSAREHSAERVQHACDQFAVAQEQVREGFQQARENSAERVQQACDQFAVAQEQVRDGFQQACSAARSQVDELRTQVEELRVELAKASAGRAAFSTQYMLFHSVWHCLPLFGCFIVLGFIAPMTEAAAAAPIMPDWK